MLYFNNSAHKKATDQNGIFLQHQLMSIRFHKENWAKLRKYLLLKSPELVPGWAPIWSVRRGNAVAGIARAAELCIFLSLSNSSVPLPPFTWEKQISQTSKAKKYKHIITYNNNNNNRVYTTMVVSMVRLGSEHFSQCNGVWLALCLLLGTSTFHIQKLFTKFRNTYFWGWKSRLTG